MVVIAAHIPNRRNRFYRLPVIAFFAWGLLAPLLLFIILLSDNPVPRALAAPLQQEKKFTGDDSLLRITISFTGDLMCHSPQFNNARQADGSYDFNPSWDMMRQRLSEADYTIGNLETTCAGAARGYSGYPAFNAPDEYVAALKNAGFDMLVTSNNHSMDTGEEGLQRTIGVIGKNGLAYTGTFTSQQDRDSVRILDLKSIRIAVLNYTYGTNGAYPSKAHAWMLNVYDSTLVKNDIDSARKNGAELVLVFYHWGAEYRADPMWPKQDTMMQTAIRSGADLIIGSHPHVVGPVTCYKTKNAALDSGLVAWTLGNFISNQSGRYKDAGVVLTVELTKNRNTGAIYISKTEYTPTWVYRGTDPSNKNYIVMPASLCSSDSLPAWINADSKVKLTEAFSDTKAMINRYSAKPIPR